MNSNGCIHRETMQNQLPWRAYSMAGSEFENELRYVFLSSQQVCIQFHNYEYAHMYVYYLDLVTPSLEQVLVMYNIPHRGL